MQHPDYAALIQPSPRPEVVAHLSRCPRCRSDRAALLTEGSLEAGLAPIPDRQLSLPSRYEDLGTLGSGGMGEVRRVRDRELGRTCAFKVIRADLAGKPSVVARFLEEMQVAAQLQHPNIAPVYDAGALPDGRLWFTMKEVRGRTLADLIREAHAGLTDAGLRRLCEMFASVCDAVAYAHARGVVHRDLKPENVMVGAHGEVLVLDWGLAKVLGRPAIPYDEPDVSTARSTDDALKTKIGGVIGTPAYMPPEQARGGTVDARSDCYALGAMLYVILSGEPPHRALGRARLAELVVSATPPPLPSALPPDLTALCARCMARDPGERPPEGGAVAADVRAWLDGSKRRQKGLEVVADAEASMAEEATLRARAAASRSKGEALLSTVAPWAPEDDKVAGWALVDEADRLERTAILLELKREALLVAALTHAPGLGEAHAALVALETGRHRAAEVGRDGRECARAEARIREHAEALPEGHPARATAATYLRGDGALTLVTDVDGAEVLLHRYETKNRRLVPAFERNLGRTPLDTVPLPMGSYLCTLTHPDRAPVRYPVAIGRGEHWDGIRPGARSPLPIRLPHLGELGPDECLVPAGWFWSGGDAEAMDSLPRRRLWCDEVVFQRFPMTNIGFIAFLDDLVSVGREADALRFAPRERAMTGDGSMIFARDAHGRFHVGRDADGDLWEEEFPVALILATAVQEYAMWYAAKTGRPWRLPGEYEWEKAARGVDGRFHPWGDGFDPSWCMMRQSHPTTHMAPAKIDTHPVDESPYGIRGLGGNASDWCAEMFSRDGAPLDGSRVIQPPSEPTKWTSPGLQRGGNWAGPARNCRAAFRNRGDSHYRSETLGFRLVYDPRSA